MIKNLFSYLNPFKLINKLVTVINENSSIMIIVPWTEHYGDYCEDIYYALRRARMEEKKVLFLFPQHELFWKFKLGTVKNIEVGSLQSDFRILSYSHPFCRILGWYLTLYHGLFKAIYLLIRKFQRGISQIIPLYKVSLYNSLYTVPNMGDDTIWMPKGVKKFNWAEGEKILKRWEQELQKPFELRIDSDLEKEAEIIRLKMGVPKKAWFVTLHVRSGGSRNDNAFNNHRNATIENYIPAIRYITEQGGYVVRIGDKSMERLSVKIDHFIDYVHTPYLSHLMDTYLMKHCRFYLGMTSGAEISARFFDKPKLLVNMSEWSITFPMLSGDRCIFKHFYSKHQKKFLSIQDLINEPPQSHCGNNPPGEDYIIYENSPEEILLATKEFLQNFQQEKQSDIQKEFTIKRALWLRTLIDENQLAQHPEHYALENFRTIGSSLVSKGSLTNSFLRDNWDKNSRSHTLG